MNDPIVDEVRRVRAEHAERFRHDLWAIFRDIKEQQARSGLNFVSFADNIDDGAEGPAITDEELAERAKQIRAGDAVGIPTEQAIEKLRRKLR
jgi:hypothetical protein